jgi:hypothetical protein
MSRLPRPHVAFLLLTLAVAACANPAAPHPSSTESVGSPTAATLDDVLGDSTAVDPASCRSGYNVGFGRCN